MQIDERIAAGFVLRNLADRSSTEYLGRPELADVVRLVTNGQDIAAAQHHQVLTGAPLQECRFAVQVAQRFLG